MKQRQAFFTYLCYFLLQYAISNKLFKFQNYEKLFDYHELFGNLFFV